MSPPEAKWNETFNKWVLPRKTKVGRYYEAATMNDWEQWMQSLTDEEFSEFHTEYLPMIQGSLMRGYIIKEVDRRAEGIILGQETKSIRSTKTNS